jgi:serine/threonine-protein kinase
VLTFAAVGEPSDKPAELESAGAPAADAPAVSPGHQATERAPATDGDGWIGRVVDERYRVVRRLGEGGMGAVFVAEHLTLHKPVALKVVRAELAGNGEVAARFAREAMATAQFEHPHVASAIDYGTLPEGGAYFVMQLVRGRSLRPIMSGGRRLPWRRACEIAAQVADALSAAKSAGIIHRDLKPDNILVERREDGSDLVKVLDFGIAHVAPREAASETLANRALTRVGTVMGTPGYMAPEQAVGDKVDHRADLYALGVVLWESITGRELWQGPDLTSVVTRQMTEAVPRLRELVDDATLHPELDELLQRLTARAAADRPEHAAEVRDVLRRLAHASDSPLSPARALAALQNSLRDSSVGPWVKQAAERYSAQPKAVRRLQAGVVALGALALVLTLVPGDQPQPTAGEPQPAASEPQPQAPLQSAPAQPEDPSPQTQPTVMDKMVKATADVVQKAVPKLRPEPPPFPPALATDVTIMLDAESPRDRRSAAEKVHAYQPAAAVAQHLRVIAELERARGCKTRKQAIAIMKSQADVRYLPPLQRLARSPRSGCGFLNLADCLSCIRGDLREALAVIEKKLPQPGSTLTAPAPHAPPP